MSDQPVRVGAPGTTLPTSTYRLQVNGEFGFADVADVADYLDALGVTHAYLSPVLQPEPGSMHGYDVVDHTSVNADAGGREAFDLMIEALHARGLGVILDVVPNHMAMPVPEYLNRPLWQVLKHGRDTPYARWFDVDWAASHDRIVVPVLGHTPEQTIAEGEMVLAHDGGPDRDEVVVRYYDHELPVKPGTEDLPLRELLGQQWWRLEGWRAGSSILNYRRFFDVTSLVGLRVEDPGVFAASHALLAQLVADGSVDGLRIDHPDGLADPRGYLRHLAAATGGVWVVVEKILEGDEQLPEDWPCAGTTGYDLLWRVGALFVDPAGEEPLTDLLALTTGSRLTLDEVVTASKQLIVGVALVPEVLRLAREMERVCAATGFDATSDLHGRIDPESVERSLGALLVAMDRYRAYVVPGEPVPVESFSVVDRATEHARSLLGAPDLPTLDVVRNLVLGVVPDQVRAEHGAAVDDLVVRFQQTCGPVMAKGIEDTAFYRWHRLIGLNEVGADPDHFAVSPDELFGFVERLAGSWPATMTTLSTHDTKRSEDVRARLNVLSELPGHWHEWLRQAQEKARPYRSQGLDGATEYLLWQTLVGAWPIDEERLQAYATKAIREAKQHTQWTAPDEGYERAVSDFVTGVLGDAELTTHVESWLSATASATRANTLGQKLIQLVLPGVTDVYQGTELVDLSLVDPDNRRPVDYARRREALRRLDSGQRAGDLDEEKLLVTSRALRLRRDHPGWFVGESATLRRIPSGDERAVAVGRGDGSGDQVVAVVSRLTASSHGWGDATLELPAGSWADQLTGRTVSSDGSVLLGELLADLPVALLVRDAG